MGHYHVRLVAALVSLLALAHGAAAQELTANTIVPTGTSVTLELPSGSGHASLVANAGTFDGTVTANLFSGSCASCTNLNAGNVASGNLPWANLPSGSGTWTSTPTISGTLTMGGDLVPSLADTYVLGNSTKPWKQSYISQINGALFALQTQTLVGGWLDISKNAGTFPGQVNSTDTTINFGTAMTNGQFVVVRSFNNGGSLATEYIKVGTLFSGTTYNVTRNLSGAGAQNWPAGTPFQVRGVAGDGWVELDAFDSPRVSIWTQGSAYNNSTENVRIGYLAGMPNSVSGIGFYAGDASNYVYYDGTNFKLNSASVGIDSNGITVAADTTLFSSAKAYKWSRTGESGMVPTTCASGNSGDQFGIGAFDTALTSSTEFSEIDLHNTMAGHNPPSCAGRAFVDIAAQGWNGTVAGNNTEIRLGSDPSNPLADGISMAASQLDLSSVTKLKWTSFTPTLTATPGPATWTVGSGSVDCNYAQLADLVVVDCDIENTTVTGSPSVLTLSLPFTATHNGTAQPLVYFLNGAWANDGFRQVTGSSLLLEEFPTPGTTTFTGSGFYARLIFEYRK